jgi:hypothetical protein
MTAVTAEPDTGADWAGRGFSTPYPDPEMEPGQEAQARLDQLAADCADAADAHGVDSPEHDAAMDAWAESRAEAEPEPEAS